ncbi:MAG: SRPBCC family protein [Pseudomonadota bacterium]
MTEKFDCTPVGIDFLEQTRNLFLAEEVVRATPEQIFDVFEDAHAWTVWAMPIQKVVWTSPQPYGVGTTRSVHMMGGLIGYEEFIEWDRGKRMAFTFLADNKGATEKFLEDYRVLDLGDGTCRVQWYMAMEPRGFSRHMMFLTRPVMRIVNQRMFGKFRKYVEAYAQGELSLGVT